MGLGFSVCDSNWIGLIRYCWSLASLCRFAFRCLLPFGSISPPLPSSSSRAGPGLENNYVFVHVAQVLVSLRKAIIAGLVVIVESSFHILVHICPSFLVNLSELHHIYPSEMRASLFC